MRLITDNIKAKLRSTDNYEKFYSNFKKTNSELEFQEKYLEFYNLLCTDSFSVISPSNILEYIILSIARDDYLNSKKIDISIRK